MILIDDRAGSRDLSSIPPLTSISELCRLSSADVCFTGNGPRGSISIGIEVKQISDVIASRKSGRLQGLNGQVSAMLDDYDQQWIVTYGTYRCGQDGRLQVIKRVGGPGSGSNKYAWQDYRFNNEYILYAYVESALISLSDVGFRHHHVSANHDDGLEQVARFIGALYLKRQKSWQEQCKMFHALNKSGDVTKSSLKRHLSGITSVDDNLAALPIEPDLDLYQRVKCAASLPGVNYHRAIALAEHFPSVIDMFTADENELAKVDGIGKILSANIVSAIRNSKANPRSRNKR